MQGDRPGKMGHLMRVQNPFQLYCPVICSVHYIKLAPRCAWFDSTVSTTKFCCLLPALQFLPTEMFMQLHVCLHLAIPYIWVIKHPFPTPACICVKVLKECLGDAKSWADMWRASGRHDMAASHVPIIVHEDAVPHFSGFLVLILEAMKQSENENKLCKVPCSKKCS